MGSFARRILGRSGLSVSPLGIGASYGVPAQGIEEAVEHGINYLYWGSLRRGEFAQALRNLRPRRDGLVVVLQSFSRIASLLNWSVERGLRHIGYDYADVLLLGYWNDTIPPRIFDAARRLKQRGLVRHLAVSSHNRPLIAGMIANPELDIFHVRYNAVHRGAEKDIFPHLAAGESPGVVAYTATCWGRLLQARHLPPGERAPEAADCYRFALSHPAVHLCMTGPASLEEARQAMRALRSVPMSEEELAWMRRLGDYSSSK